MSLPATLVTSWLSQRAKTSCSKVFSNITSPDGTWQRMQHLIKQKADTWLLAHNGMFELWEPFPVVRRVMCQQLEEYRRQHAARAASVERFGVFMCLSVEVISLFSEY